jgi:hypothetical protein
MQPDKTAPTPGTIRPYVSNKNGWLGPAMLFAIIVITRWIYISLYGSDMPYWDQWDSEAALLLKPWQEGTWTPMQLLSLHNEHRIAYTRILSLILFELNGQQWDNLVEAYTTAILLAGTFTLVFVSLRKYSTKATASVAWIAVAAIGCLPYSWENVLVGFQSQFYFLLLFSILMLATVAFRPSSPLTTVILALLALMVLVAGASGCLAACAVLFVIVARAWHVRNLTRRDIAAAATLVAVAGLGFHLIPYLPASDWLQAKGLDGYLGALLTGLSWPLETLPDQTLSLTQRLVFACVFWLPSAFALGRVIRRQRMSPSTWFALGVSALVFAQLAAVAHSRGHDTLHLASRYMDLPALGLAMNAWLAVDMLERQGTMRVARIILGIAFACLATYALALRTPWDVKLVHERAYYTGKETSNVAAYMASGDATWLDQPPLEIPYPSAARLRQLLDDPTIAEMLPPSIRRPLLLTGHGDGFEANGLPQSWLSPPGTTAIGSFSARSAQATFTSGTIQSRRPYLEVRQMGRKAKAGITRLWLEDDHGRTYPFTAIAKRSDLRWNRAFAASPREGFHFRALDNAPDRWIAFASLVEAGPLSASAARFQDAVRRLLPRAYDAPAETGSAPPSATPPDGQLASGGVCSVDLVNGQPPQATVIDTSVHSLRLDGWALISPAKGIENEGITIAITPDNGPSLYQAAQKTLRPDVNRAFLHPELGNVGYQVHIDTNGLSGSYRLEVVQKRGGQQLVCVSPVIRVRITH